MKFAHRLLLSLVLLVAPSSTAFAEDAFVFAGRYLDGGGGGIRVPLPMSYSAKRVDVVPERGRIYMAFGQTFVAYEIDNFFSRLGDPLARVIRGGSADEGYLPYDYYEDPQRSGGWETPISDSYERLYDYDWDDRDYVYLAYDIWGFGIVRDTGSSLSLVRQVKRSEWGDVRVIEHFSIGSEHYVFVAHHAAAAVWNVTDPASPVMVRSFATGAIAAADARSGSNRIVAIAGPTSLEIWLATDLIGEGVPTTTIAATSGNRFSGVSTDGTNFFASEETPGPSENSKLVVLSPDSFGSAVYTSSKRSLDVDAIGVKWGRDHIIVWGSQPDGKLRYDVAQQSGTHVVSVTTTRSPVPWTDADIYRYGGNDYLLVSSFYSGDAYFVGLEDPPPPVIGFDAVAWNVSEGSGVTVRVRRSGDSSPQVSVRYRSESGTATALLDFVPVDGMLTFEPGVLLRSFDVSTLQDDLVEPTETVQLRLSEPSPGSFVVNGEAVLNLKDRPPPAVVKFSSSEYAVSETAGEATIQVTRTGDLTPAFSVSYETQGGTADDGLDFLTTAGSLTFASGDTEKTFTVPILTDQLVESAETVILRLSNPSSPAVLGTSEATLYIDDVPPPAGQLHLAGQTARVDESAGNWMATIHRDNGSAGIVTVLVSTQDDTATAGSDYEATRETVTLWEGETERSISIPVINDSYVEGNEAFTVTLSNPTGRATLGAPDSTIVTIEDDDLEPVRLALDPRSMTIREGEIAVVTIEIDPVQSSSTRISLSASNRDAISFPSTVTLAPGVGRAQFEVRAVTTGSSTLKARLPGSLGGASKGIRVLVTGGVRIEEISPATGSSAGGNVVRVSGSAFDSNCRLLLGELAARIDTLEESAIEAMTPPHPSGMVDVTVLCSETKLDSRSDGYSFVQAAPTVESVEPSIGEDSGGTFVTLHGSDFQRGCRVLFGETLAQSVDIIDAGELYAVTPPHDPGETQVRVVCGRLTSSVPAVFTFVGVEDALPRIESVRNASEAPGFEVTISGERFRKGCRVFFGVNEASVLRWGPSSLVVVVPEAVAGQYPTRVVYGSLEVTGPDLEITQPLPPVIDRIEPGVVTNGSEIEVTGSGFLPSHEISIEDAALHVLERDHVRIVARIDSSLAGTRTLRVGPGAGPVAESSITIVEFGGVPTIRHVTPACSSRAGGASIRVYGTGFEEGMRVTIGGATAREVEVLDSTTIEIITPAGLVGPATVEVGRLDGGTARLVDGVRYYEPSDESDPCVVSRQRPARPR